jgi:predicted component of type VI protein secretion system
MKLYLPMIVSVLLAVTLVAAAAEDNDPDAEQPVEQQQKPAAVSAPQRPAPSPTFTPSEKVGADSAVSFPVDI